MLTAALVSQALQRVLIQPRMVMWHQHMNTSLCFHRLPICTYHPSPQLAQREWPLPHKSCSYACPTSLADVINTRLTRPSTCIEWAWTAFGCRRTATSIIFAIVCRHANTSSALQTSKNPKRCSWQPGLQQHTLFMGAHRNGHATSLWPRALHQMSPLSFLLLFSSQLRSERGLCTTILVSQ